MNLLNVLWLTPSLKTRLLVTPRPNQLQPRSPFDFMHSRMNWSRLQLQVCGRQAQLLGSDYLSWHHVCYTSNHQVLIRSKATAWWGSSLPDLLFEEDSWFGPTFQAWFHQGFWVLLWCRLLRAVEQGICTCGLHYFQVTKWLNHFLAGCLVSWASKLQSQVTLSTTEAEYIAMSQALCDVIPIMRLLQKMIEQGFKVLCTKPYVYCKVF